MKRFNVLCLLALIALETEARVPLGVNQYRDSDQRYRAAELKGIASPVQ